MDLFAVFELYFEKIRNLTSTLLKKNEPGSSLELFFELLELLLCFLATRSRLL
jgi:hypothetical protein